MEWPMQELDGLLDDLRETTIRAIELCEDDDAKDIKDEDGPSWLGKIRALRGQLVDIKDQLPTLASAGLTQELDEEQAASSHYENLADAVSY